MIAEAPFGRVQLRTGYTEIQQYPVQFRRSGFCQQFLSVMEIAVDRPETGIVLQACFRCPDGILIPVNPVQPCGSAGSLQDGFAVSAPAERTVTVYAVLPDIHPFQDFLQEHRFMPKFHVISPLKPVTGRGKVHGPISVVFTSVPSVRQSAFQALPPWRPQLQACPFPAEPAVPVPWQ